MKVGDRVKVFGRAGLIQFTGETGIVKGRKMDSNLSYTIQFDTIFSDELHDGDISDKNDCYWVSYDNLKPIDQDEIDYVVRPPYVYAIKDGEIGISKCHSDDKFDEEFGKKLAKARLEGDKATENEILGVVDWDKVEVGTPISFEARSGIYCRYFYKLEGDILWTFRDGSDLFTIERAGCGQLSSWDYFSNLKTLTQEEVDKIKSENFKKLKERRKNK